jgi:transcriptional regulator with XRE-family HTH domain
VTALQITERINPRQCFYHLPKWEALLETDALDLTFQQVQKYESGKNRISAGRLQHLSQILPVAFFFECTPSGADAAPATPPT